ncbi:MAG: DMT family transporter [Candidatus Marinimicrobia bacterium]|jgi:drug/metabolite transporter (DMT)-like permease|nr:DMT family transporter [Candidatus Neomarinimicrobiota bacterium]MDX9777660.1 DMT family transporter [bacterium]
MIAKMTRTNIMLLSAALLWGLGFVAQRDGMSYVGPFTYSAIRFGIGLIALLPVYLLTRRQEKKIPAGRKTVLRAGLLVGLFLFLAVSAQQIGLMTSTAAKAGFITSLYMILVPVFGLFLGQRTTMMVWVSIALALCGVYLMAVTGNFRILPGDLWVLLCAVLWAVHFLFIAHYSSRVGPIRLSMMQFLLCAILSALTAFFTESLSLSALTAALPSLLYGGIGAVGIAYTLHVVALRDANPAYASLILSMESVFAALGGWLILSEGMSTRQLIGAALILFAVLLTQLRLRPQARAIIRQGDET